MSRIIYVNGRYQYQHEAQVSVNDRGFQWGDSVYVVFTHIHQRFIDIDLHLNKLKDYAAAIEFDLPFHASIIVHICRKLIQLNRLNDAAIYIQLTRGAAQRVHHFPESTVQPSLIITAQPYKFVLNPDDLEQIAVITTYDIRWRRASIKTNAAIANVLLRQQAHSQGCFESWLLDDDGYIVEGASSNAYIVGDDNVILTPPANGSIVPGVTRERLMLLACHNQIKIKEQKFDLKTVLSAREAFISGAKSMIKSVSQINGHKIGNGKPGVMTKKISQLYYDYCNNG